MKKILYLILFVSAISCSKKDADPAPDLATQASGTYQVNRLGYNGTFITLPTSTQSANIVITRTDATQVSFVATITNGNTSTKYPYTGNLSQNGSTINIALALVADPSATKTTATINANKLVMTETQGSVSGVFEASK